LRYTSFSSQFDQNCAFETKNPALGIGRATVLYHNAELVNPCKIDDIWLLFRFHSRSHVVLSPNGHDYWFMGQKCERNRKIYM